VSTAGEGVQRIGKELLARVGLHVSRGPANRFEAMERAIADLRARGYAPRAVIDGGANVGRWTELTHSTFPNAAYFLVEPQPACLPLLEAVKERLPAVEVFNCALTQPGVDSVGMVGSGSDSTSEGAWIPTSGESADGLQVKAATLDSLFADRFQVQDRVFLKLDSEGYEYNAFLGATELLKCVEVILSEVRFYDVSCSGHQVFSQIVSLLLSHGFIVYDFARLVARPRDGRLFFGDALFVRSDSELAADVQWR